MFNKNLYEKQNMKKRGNDSLLLECEFLEKYDILHENNVDAKNVLTV